MSTAVRLSGEALRPFLHPIHHQESWRLDLFIKGVHCSHCVYKIEKALKEKSQVPSYQFQAGGEKLSLWSQDPGHFSEAIDQIHQLGFSAIPISEKQNWQLLEEQDYKLALKRLAVAGVCAGNIMLFSIAVYLGADQGFTQFFHKLSFFLILPSLTYSAWPIWKGFMKGILNFRFNLDIPIGLALLTGFVLSSISLLGSQTQIYYDSLSVVIFLVLSSRFVLSRYVNRIYQKNIIHSVPGVYQARRILSDETQQMVPPESLKPGDWVQVERGEVLPVDGKLLSPRAIVDNSILTGESSPVVYKRSEKLFAGSRLCAESARIEVEQVGEKTRVGDMMGQALRDLRLEKEESFFWVSRLTLFVVLAALATFFYFTLLGQWGLGFERAFAIIIVACPCAVSFGIPLIRFFSGQLAMREGFLLKSPQVLKKLKTVSHICFDKTGTLTEARLQIDPKGFETLNKEDQLALLSLELFFDHPISKGFYELYDGVTPLLPVEDFHYHPGFGIEGKVSGDHWQVSEAKSVGSKTLQVQKNGENLTQIELKPDTKEQLDEVFSYLANKNFQISLLSGDKSHHVEPLFARIPQKAQGSCLAELTPEDKKSFVKTQGEKGLMIGDGINDVSALSEAHLSLCMPGALENNMNVADISLVKGHLSVLPKIFQLWKKLELTEKKLFTFTSIYNLSCVSLAALGYITPIFAAILMPLSSVVVITLVTTSLRRL